MSLAKIGLNLIERTGFTRLKGIFRKGINYNGYEQIVDSAKNKIVGNLPKDMLNLIIKRNPQNKAECIKTAQKAFENASLILSEGEILQKQAINRMRPTLENTCKIVEDIERKDILYDKLFIDKNIEMLCKAESEIYKKLKPVFPELANIKLSLIGEGGFANAYRCQILDKNKQSIVADTVIKSFKSGTENSELTFKKLNQMFSKYSNEEILQYAKQNGLNITQEQINSTKKLISTTLDEIRNNRVQYQKFTLSMHGAKAEANSSEYLRHFSGHKLQLREGISIPDMFYLGENPFCISKYVDSTQKAKKSFNFERLGLSHTDFQVNPNNGINGICIDIGGLRPKLDTHLINKRNLISSTITATQSDIVGNKFATRILKHINNLGTTEEIIAYIKSLEDYAAKCKNELEKKTIFLTLKEIRNKNLYPTQYNTYQVGKSAGMFIEEEEIEELLLDSFIKKALTTK